MKAAAHLYGADLQKCLTESITKTRLERQTHSFVCEGTPQPFEEAEAEWKDKNPKAWAEIQKNAAQFTCPVTKMRMINANMTLH